MIWGSFRQEEKLPTIPVGLSFKKAIFSSMFILDTGFSGDLKIGEETAASLGIVPKTFGYTINANGKKTSVGLAQGYAEMEGRKAPITIHITNGPHLAGIGLFTVFKYKVVVDCRSRETYLE